MKARNDENLEGIQSLARELDRLLPGGGARGEAIAELQAHAEAAERELAAQYETLTDQIEGLEAILAAVREPLVEIAENLERRDPHDETAAKLRIILHRLDGKGEK